MTQYDTHRLDMVIVTKVVVIGSDEDFQVKWVLVWGGEG